MARNCGCGGASCGCLIEAGNGITITGIGTAADPFRVTADIGDLDSAMSFQNSATVTWSITGSGTPIDPLVISATSLRQNLPAYTTAGRPSAATAGVGGYYYDTTLSKPGFSNGTLWKDAAGTNI